MTDETSNPRDHQEETWAKANQRVRMLCERVVFYRDEGAYLELLDEFRPFVARLAGTVRRPADRDDVTARLAETIAKALGRAAGADQPKAYLCTALRHRLITEVRVFDRRAKREILSETVDANLPDPSAQLAIDRGLLDSEEHENCLETIAWLHKQARDKRSSTDEKVVQVIEIRYYYPDLTVVESCRALGFSAAEERTISQKISRARENPRSVLHKAASGLLGQSVMSALRIDQPLAPAASPEEM